MDMSSGVCGQVVARKRRRQVAVDTGQFDKYLSTFICLQVYIDWWLAWKMLKTGICGKFDKYLSTIHIHLSSGECRQVASLKTGGCGQFDEDLASPG